MFKYRYLFVFILLLTALVGCGGKEVKEGEITSIEELNTPNHRVGLPQGAAAMYAGEAIFDKAELIYSSHADGCMAVEYGKIDAYVFDKHILEYAVSNNPNIKILENSKIADEEIVIGSAFGNEELISRVNEFIRQYKADGTYEDMYNRWIRGKSRVMPDIPIPENPEGKLIVGTEGLNVPMNYHGEKDELLGFDIEFAKRLANFLNMDLDIETMEFSALISSGMTGKIDLLIANLNGTDAVREAMLVTDSYIKTEIAVVVKNYADENGVMSFFEDIKESFIKTFIDEGRWKMILSGIGVTLVISIFSALFGTILGFGICMLRRSKNKAFSNIAKLYINIIQGTPVVVLLMIIYYVIFKNVQIDGIIVAIVGFSLNFAAYTCEMMRTGIEAVSKGQIEAAKAIGFNRFQTFTKIVMPQAARHFLPVYKGEFISLVKMTAIVGYIAIKDLTQISYIIRSKTYEAFFPLVATAIIYFILAHILASILNLIQSKILPSRKNRTIKGVNME